MRKAKRHFAENFLCRNVLNSGFRSFNREIADFNRQGHFTRILILLNWLWLVQSFSDKSFFLSELSDFSHEKFSVPDFLSQNV